MRNASEERGGRLVLYTAPSAELRERMRQRSRNLTRALQHVDRGAMAVAIAGMLRSLSPNRKVSDDEAKKSIAQFVAIVEGLPTWAVQRACHALSSGKVDGVSLDFLPTTARLRQVAESYCTPLWDEQVQLHKLLEAEVEERPPESERLRVGQGLRSLADALAANAAAMDPKPKPKRAPTNDELMAIYAKPKSAQSAEGEHQEAAE